MVHHVQRVSLGQTLYLVVERKQFARLGTVHGDSFALARNFRVVNFALAFGCEIRARAHGERRGNHAGESCEQNVFGVACRGAGDAGDNAEDCAQAIIHSVDGIANPSAGLLAALVALGQHLFQHSFGINLGRSGRRLVVAANQRAQLAMMIFFVFDDVIKNGDGAFVAQILQLAAVAGNVAALFNLQPAQRHADAAGAIGQRIGLAAGRAGVLGLGSSEFRNAALPQRGVLQLGLRQVAQYLRAQGVGVAVSQRLVGVVTLHFGLPVAFKRGEDLLQLGTVDQSDGHGFLLGLWQE